MSLTQEQMLDVMALADGELADEDRARIEKLVESDVEAKELLASLHAIGDGIRGAVDFEGIDVRDAVMAKITPNDLDKARIKRTARTRMVVVGASLVALAAAVLLYVKTTSHPVAKNAAGTSSSQAVLASVSPPGVQVDFVDTPTPVSVFYVPAESASTAPQAKEPPPSVVVWVDDNAPQPDPEKTK